MNTLKFLKYVKIMLDMSNDIIWVGEPWHRRKDVITFSI